MRRFDSKGMMVIPNPLSEKVPTQKKVIVATEAYCPAGHDLVSGRAVFGAYHGIVLGVRQDQDRGTVALSPIYGEKTRVSIDIDLQDGCLLELRCPECDVLLPTYAPCSCGGNLTALFLAPGGDFADCIGVCNRVNCVHAQITQSGDLLSLSMLSRE